MLLHRLNIEINTKFMFYPIEEYEILKDTHV